MYRANLGCRPFVVRLEISFTTDSFRYWIHIDFHENWDSSQTIQGFISKNSPFWLWNTKFKRLFFFVLQIITEINSNSVKNQKFILKPNLKMTISQEYNIFGELGLGFNAPKPRFLNYKWNSIWSPILWIYTDSFSWAFQGPIVLKIFNRWHFSLNINVILWRNCHL